MRPALSLGLGLNQDPVEELLYVNFYGPPGNAKSTLFQWLMATFQGSAFALQKDTDRSFTLRPGEELIREYRNVPSAQLRYRWRSGHYRYKPLRFVEKGRLNLTGIPKVEYLPNIPPRTRVVGSVFPLDPEHPIHFPGRRTIQIFVMIEDMDILRARLKARCGDDIANYERKVRLNEDFRAGRLRENFVPPHLYFPEMYDHVIYTDGTMGQNLRQLARIIPEMEKGLGL